MRTSECEAHEKYGLYYSYQALPVSVLFPLISFTSPKKDGILVVYFYPKIALIGYQSFRTQPGQFVPGWLGCFEPKVIKYVLYLKYF